MLHFLFIVSFIGFVSSDGLDKFAGNWTVPIMVFAKGDVTRQMCDVINLKTTKDVCTCGATTVPAMTLTIANKYEANIPVLATENFDDVKEYVNLKCDCGLGKKTLVILRYLTDNYVIYKFTSEEMYLIAKNLPTEEELNDFVLHNDVLQGVSGNVNCVKKTKEDVENRKTVTRKVVNVDTDYDDDTGASDVWLNFIKV